MIGGAAGAVAADQILRGGQGAGAGVGHGERDALVMARGLHVGDVIVNDLAAGVLDGQGVAVSGELILKGETVSITRIQQIAGPVKDADRQRDIAVLIIDLVAFRDNHAAVSIDNCQCAGAVQIDVSHAGQAV